MYYVILKFFNISASKLIISNKVNRIKSKLLAASNRIELDLAESPSSNI